MSLPTCFRVIGIGKDTEEIIETVNCYGYDCVSATVVTDTIGCVPTDQDKMVIIVAKDNEDKANSIAKTFHDAGVLTLGLVDKADSNCYDSVMSATSHADYPDLIKAILQPVATQGMITYDFNDLKTTLADSEHFFIKSVTRCGNERVAEAIRHIQRELTASMLNNIELISIFLYFHREGPQPLAMKELTALTGFVSQLPERVYVTQALYPDEDIKDHAIKITILAAGKELKI